MAGLEWAHAVAAIAGAVIGAVSAIFMGGVRFGRMESRLKLHFQTAIAGCEKQIEAKVEEARKSFDETLKGLRQKINDVELDAEKRFLQKEEFNDFRQEYREDMRELKQLVQKGS